jgi:hypothetical protein
VNAFRVASWITLDIDETVTLYLKSVPEARDETVTLCLKDVPEARMQARSANPASAIERSAWGARPVPFDQIPAVFSVCTSGGLWRRVSVTTSHSWS